MTTSDLTLTWNGNTHPARPIAAGAAFELFSDTEAPGFFPAPQQDRYPFHSFVAAWRIDPMLALEAPDPPLTVPLGGVDVSTVHQMSQGRRPNRLVRAVRESARILPGTKMIKPLSPRQAARLLTSAPHVAGVCFREHDTAHLRTPQQRRVLDADPHEAADVSFALRWRASDPADYSALSTEHFPGLASLPASDFRGAPILGGGFVPSDGHLIPEFVTSGLADIPLPDRAELLAYNDFGLEVVAFQYLAERDAWTRMAGPRWRDLVSRIPGITAGQQAFPVAMARHVGLFGVHDGQSYPAVADPPDEFRMRATSAAARFAVRDVSRTYLSTVWRGAACLVVGVHNDRVRLRLRQPGNDSIRAADAGCVERGLYECWVPGRDVGEVTQLEHHYRNR